MHVVAGALSVSPTDLANFLACRHKTSLDFLTARGELAKPSWQDPLARVLAERGLEHEQQYLESLRDAGLSVVDCFRDQSGQAAVLAAMGKGIDVIAQAPLVNQLWSGRADILRRVEIPSALGGWSYEVQDTKLSRETRAGTLLQLCVYTELVGDLQGLMPTHMHVVTPEGHQVFRVHEVAAYYRFVKAEFLQFVSSSALARSQAQANAATYPDPCDHCDVCRWWDHCNARRRHDDHVSFCAGLGRVHQVELETRRVVTLDALAAMPVPMTPRPRRGAAETYDRLRDQARLQVLQRASGRPVHERLPIEPQRGLCRLPSPRPGDLFLDLEGDPFARGAISDVGSAGGREYLFGIGSADAQGRFVYRARWAFDDREERIGFESLVAEIVAAVERDPDVHVYHYAPYEPAALKRLMGRYATCENQIDLLLRGERFVDLFAIVRQSLRAGVESYSIKQMEPFYGFIREVELRRAGDERRVVELALETGDFRAVTDDVRASVAGYNKDDCRSTLELRNWLERMRADAIASGADIPRPDVKPGDASEKVTERQQRIEALRTRLLAGPGQDRDSAKGRETSHESAVRRLLAYLLDWQYREDKSTWWEYYRLVDLSSEELADEPAVLTGLRFMERAQIVMHATTGQPTGSVIDRYSYDAKEMDVRPKAQLRLFTDGKAFGTVVAIDRRTRTVDVKKGKATAERHPSAVFAHDAVPGDVPSRSIFRIGEAVAASGLDGTADYRAAIALLRRDPPRIGDRMLAEVPRGAAESVTDYALRIAPALNHAVLPIQGPPGAGKTFTGAHMICALVAAGSRVGVTAPSHKVVRNLLDAVLAAAAERGEVVTVGQKVAGDVAEEASAIVAFDANDAALAALADRRVHVLGGTTWLWSDEDATAVADVLVIDEAGQMSLAYAVAVSAAATSLVLLGDPQQLEQPQKGSHPDGVGVSVLQHVLGAEETMPPDRGLFLPITWRMAPALCDFTSELFYEGKLTARAGLDAQRLVGSGRFSGAGLFVVEVDHEGCRNASDEEVEAVSHVIDDLLEPHVRWIDERQAERPLTPRDILVVAPYNAHVSRLQAVLVPRGIAVGTVDKFQGQEAPVVIYSMATSRPEDAPRGLEFLYSRHRLNVATSRARAVCILVASSRLFEPDCRTPRQMQLANALCRYREMTRT